MKPHDPVGSGMRLHSWSEFREAGMLWAVNRILHLFGWVIVVGCNEAGEVIEVYPARTEWRGFNQATEELGYQRVAAWLRDAGPAVAEETLRSVDAEET